MKTLFPKCPVCGGDIVKKKVEKLLRGGKNTASVAVSAEVCLHCGERLYSTGTIKKFEEIRKKLKKGVVKEFQLVGKNFKVA
ncbi:MAG: YgiT-type zinc finger protein [Deltaproteobacteria bacterium]|nr:YgiT-type zinc finger protein [Deltaproteobacteria bacterium]